MKIKSVFIYAFVYSLVVFCFSLYILPIYTEGDQRFYVPFYNICLEYNLGLKEEFECYKDMVGSQEPGYFIVAKFFSYFSNKIFFTSVTNAILVFLITLLVFKNYTKKWDRHLFIIFLITNYYFLGLYFSVERLKIAFIFFVLAFLIGGKKRFILFGMALFTHLQMVFCILPYVLSMFMNSASKMWIKFCGLFFTIIGFLLMFIFMKDHIVTKFNAYYEDALDSNMGVVGVIKTTIIIFFACISLKKIEPLIIALPIIISSYFIGSTRLGMVVFLIYIAYIIQIKKRIDILLFFVLCYFSYKSFGFLLNVFRFGEGWS